MKGGSSFSAARAICCGGVTLALWQERQFPFDIFDIKLKLFKSLGIQAKYGERKNIKEHPSHLNRSNPTKDRAITQLPQNPTADAVLQQEAEVPQCREYFSGKPSKGKRGAGVLCGRQ